MRPRIALAWLPLLLASAGCTGSAETPAACPGAGCPADGAAAADAGTRAGADAPAREIGSSVPGLLAEYTFDQASGTVALDSSGNFRNAGLIGAMTWATGHAGGDVNFGGGYVLMPPGIVDGARELTFAAWVKARTNDRAWQRIFDFGNGTGAYLFLTTRTTDNTFRFAITRNGVDFEQKLDVTTPLALGVWKHVALVLGAAGGTLYIDGQPAATSATITLRPADIAPLTNNWLGKSQYSYDPALDGEIDDVRIYSRALSAAEITALSNGS